MRRPFEDYQDARSEFAEEEGRAAERRRERCSCNSRSESPCSGCEARAERAEYEAEAESQRHADDEATHALAGDFERCADCDEPFAPHDLLAGLCPPCSKDASDRAQSAPDARRAFLAPGESLQSAMGLADEDIPF